MDRTEGNEPMTSSVLSPSDLDRLEALAKALGDKTGEALKAFAATMSFRNAVLEAECQKLRERVSSAEQERNTAHAQAGALKGIGKRASDLEAQLSLAQARIGELEKIARELIETWRNPGPLGIMMEMPRSVDWAQKVLNKCGSVECKGRHEWEEAGACSAECDDDCSCSIPVQRCRRCDQYDYGHNAQAETIRAQCKRRKSRLRAALASPDQKEEG
jgi:hypothetical protein